MSDVTPDPPPTIDYVSSVPDAQENGPASSMSRAGFGVAAFVLGVAALPWVGVVALAATYLGPVGWVIAGVILTVYVALLVVFALLSRRIKTTEDPAGEPGQD